MITTIDGAFNAYLLGILSPWDLQEVVEEHGYTGWECTSNKKLRLFTDGKVAPCPALRDFYKR